jgi:hypothetical protein
MDNNRECGLFVLWLAATVLAGCFFSIAFVVVVDPYRIYQLIDIPGLNKLRPAPERYQEEIKLTLARKIKANVYVMGNSRAEWGFNPLELADGTSGEVPYNLAISGSGIATARSEFEYLHSTGDKPKKVILGVEFLDFLVDSDARPATAPRRPSRDGYAVDGLKWKFDAMFSMTSLMDALTTLRIQRGLEVQTTTPEGFNPMSEYKKYAREEGYFAIFRQRAEEYARTFVRKPHALRLTSTGSSSNLDDLRAMMAIAAQDGIELQIVIYPYHAQMLAMFEQSGLWPAFEEWKGILTREVDAARRNDPDAHISLWDFSGFSPFQCESVPARNDKTSVTRWYWEAGHFKQDLGDLILARLREKDQGLLPQPDKLGFPLTPANLQENRKRIARGRIACLASAPQLFEEAADLVARARTQHP